MGTTAIAGASDSLRNGGYNFWIGSGGWDVINLASSRLTPLHGIHAYAPSQVSQVSQAKQGFCFHSEFFISANSEFA